MFDRFIRLAKANKALRDARLEAALELASDPQIRAERRAEQVREAARSQLLVRAGQRLAEGDLGAARRDLSSLRRAGPHPEIEALAHSIDAAATANQVALDLARAGLDEARRLLTAGDTGAAAAVLAGVSGPHLELERKQLQQQLAERRRLAEEHAAKATSFGAAGQAVAAVASFRRATALSKEVAVLPLAREAVTQAAAAALLHDVDERLQEDDLEGALTRYREMVGELPELSSTSSLRRVERRLGDAVLKALCAAPTIAAAAPLARATLAAGITMAEPLSVLVQGLVGGDAVASDAAALAGLHALTVQVGAKALAADVERRLASATAHHQQIVVAREQLADGKLDGARELLTRLLCEQPKHEAARRELELVERGLEDLERRLDAARLAAREGRLREAAAAAMALAGSGRVGVAAQGLVDDVRTRMAVVDRGLDEVRVALHGRAAATTEGVRHSVLRLEELAKVQRDHAELPRLTTAVKTEIEALEICDRCRAALTGGTVAEALPSLGELLACRDRFLTPDRLDARAFDMLDRLGIRAEDALVAGRLTEVEACAAMFAKWAHVRPEFGARAERLRQEAMARGQAADALVASAREHLAGNDLAEAERLCEVAQLQAAESLTVRSLREELRELRRQADALARVESMAQERDYRGARRQLSELPPTPPLLRTRIYDMKQSLARAQGLEGAFLLRIDEGGEHLVVRGESISIGNVRQTRADLPVLASVAGRHASIVRSMSFHGGMQDTIVAEEGEVKVAGKSVTKHRLAAGDRIQLGAALSLLYQQPCSRSLSVGLELQGGFQVAGTDRVLLMKDRGRDGRLLLGPARDVHVRVQRATAEVEIFATGTGQVRVACATGGTIDGVAFRGEHPVAAGQLVEAAGISFVMLPWHPGA